MFIEFHWKVIKKNNLPKFFHFKLNLVAYIVITYFILHNEIIFKKYFTDR
jgi:hypothetical protein